MHAGAASRLGASEPRQEGPVDLRLVGPAVAAWAAAAIGPGPPGWPVALAVGGVVAVFAARRRPGVWPAVVAAVLCAAAASWVAGLGRAELTRGPVPALAHEGAGARVTVRVDGDPIVAGAARTVVVRATVVRAGPLRTRTPVVVLAGSATGQWLRLVPSTEVAVTARFAPPGPRDDAVAAVLRAQGPPVVTAPPNSLQRAAAGLRAGLRAAAAPLPHDARALLPALVVGDTGALDPDLAAAFRATDLSHLMAVSGANLTLVMILLTGPPGRAIRAERRGLAAALGLPLRGTAVAGAALVLGFTVVCRPSPSVLRAAVCGLITLLAIATGRRRSLLPALAAAVLLLVLWQPALARSYGFALSVLATGSLLVLAPRWSAALRARGLPDRLAEGLAAAAAAQAVCGPVVVLLSARLSLVGVPCNLLAEPAVGAATVLGLGALLAAPVAPPAAYVLAWLAGWPARWIAAVAREGAALPGAEIDWPGGRAGAALLAVVTVAAVTAGKRLRLRPWPAAACSLLLLLALLRPVPPPFAARWPPGDWRFAMCDVGQGDALALSAGPGAAVVVDTGPDPAKADRCLRALRIRSVPLLILTHFHADHVDGLPGVLRGRAVGAIETTVLDEPAGGAARVRREAAAAGIPLTRAVAGERRSLGPLAWRVLWPPAEAAALPADDPNDASVALLVRAAGLTLLLMGDLEPDAQQQLLEAVPDLPRVDVLKVPHHGSAYQDLALFARVRPRLALISVGAGNPYGHPAARTVGMLRGLGAVVLRTDRDGPIAVGGDGPSGLRTALAGSG